MKKHNKSAFTLAEVLLTLAIIGIVAALTIPALMANVQNMDTVVKLRKSQNTFQQALKLYMSNNSYTDLRTAGIFAGDEQSAVPWDAIKPYLNLTKDCGTAAGQGCFATGVMYKWLNGSDRLVMDDYNRFAKGILADGISILIWDANGNCTLDGSRTDSGPLYNTICGSIGVDLNGSKGPNQYGRDFFEFAYTYDGTVYQTGALDSDAYQCNPSGTLTAGDGFAGAGSGCTYKVLSEDGVNY